MVILLGITISLIAGCTLAPKYTRPALPVPDAWPANEAYRKSLAADTASVAQTPGWRAYFADEHLRRLIETALKNNRDLKLAALNVERARAMYGIQRAELLPPVHAAGSGSKTRVPADLSAIGKSYVSEQYSVNLGISAWEIDFFGRMRSLKDQALEEYLATKEARESAQIGLISAVAQAYLSLAADREALKLARSTLETQQASYDLIKKRYDVGIATELDLMRVKTQVETARRDSALYLQQAAIDENALNLLVGAPALSTLLPAGLSGMVAPREISCGMPSDVLLGRPDIQQAEHRLKGAVANIGAARAAFFPRISLTTMTGTASSELSGLFEAGSRTWSIGPPDTLPIFDARIWPPMKVSKVDRELALAGYEKAIQTAFKEVSDTLAIQGMVEEQLAAQQSLVDALSAAYRLSDARYTRGIDNYLSVLDAHRSLFAAQQGLVALRLAKLANQVRFYAVLGGGGTE